MCYFQRFLIVLERCLHLGQAKARVEVTGVHLEDFPETLSGQIEFPLEQVSVSQTRSGADQQRIKR